MDVVYHCRRPFRHCDDAMTISTSTTTKVEINQLKWIGMIVVVTWIIPRLLCIESDVNE